MRMGSLWIMAAAVLLAGIIGCANPLQGGEAITKYQKGQTPLLMTAPQDGTYALFGELDRTPKLSAQVKKGDPLGFKLDDDGRITAVAGQQTFPVRDQTLLWRLRR
jgi:hypothetical protein